jgi:hypothetical protein
VVLDLFARLDQLVDRVGREMRAYEIVCVDREGKFDELDAIFHARHMRIRNRKRMKQNGSLVGQWEIEARVADHFTLAEKLLADPEIKELRY